MSFLERIIKYIAPHLCIVCQAEGKIMCDACRITTVIPLPSSCFLCNKVTQDFAVCKGCSKKTKLRRVWAVSLYDGVVKKVIWHFKYKYVRAASAVLAAMIKDAVVLPKYDLVTFIPTASTRVRSRGFDHAELLAHACALEMNMPCRRLLERTTQTRQVGATRKDRMLHMEQAFRLRVHSSTLQHKRVLIVDDVVSTGATLMAAAKVLKRGGARSVDAVVVARNTRSS